jgi:hypothetical protein
VREWLQRPLVLGTVAAVVTAVVGVTAVLIVAAALESGDASAARPATTTTTHREPGRDDRGLGTTPTTAGVAHSSAPAGKSGTAGTLPATGGTTPTTAPAPDPADDAPDPPDPRDAFQRGPVAPGISVSIRTCAWSGGRLRADGTMSYTGSQDTFWALTVSWLVNNQGQDEELDFDSDVYDLVSGQTVSWSFSSEQPTPPPNLSCAYSVQ